MVDDDAPFLAIISMVLRRHGFRVDGAAGVSAAREQAKAARYDAALVDVRLRDGSGAELARELQERYGLAGRVALMTGGIFKQPGRCLYKPFGIDELLGIMVELSAQGAPPAPCVDGAAAAS